MSTAVSAAVSAIEGLDEQGLWRTVRRRRKRRGGSLQRSSGEALCSFPGSPSLKFSEGTVSSAAGHRFDSVDSRGEHVGDSCDSDVSSMDFACVEVQVPELGAAPRIFTGSLPGDDDRSRDAVVGRGLDECGGADEPALLGLTASDESGALAE